MQYIYIYIHTHTHKKVTASKFSENLGYRHRLNAAPWDQYAYKSLIWLRVGSREGNTREKQSKTKKKQAKKKKNTHTHAQTKTKKNKTDSAVRRERSSQWIFLGCRFFSAVLPCRYGSRSCRSSLHIPGFWQSLRLLFEWYVYAV